MSAPPTWCFAREVMFSAPILGYLSGWEAWKGLVLGQGFYNQLLGSKNVQPAELADLLLDPQLGPALPFQSHIEWVTGNRPQAKCNNPYLGFLI